MKQESEETDYFCKHNNFQARHKQDMDSDLFIYPDAWRHNLIVALYSDSKSLNSWTPLATRRQERLSWIVTVWFTLSIKLWFSFVCNKLTLCYWKLINASENGLLWILNTTHHTFRVSLVLIALIVLKALWWSTSSLPCPNGVSDSNNKTMVLIITAQIGLKLNIHLSYIFKHVS